jgi:WhiB family redox-sensing transcriptional regulator
MDWRDDAACRVEDPELFFPIGTTEPAQEQTREAKIVCAVCAVQPQCLAWALRTAQDAGIWGGLDGDERRSLRRRTQRSKAADESVARR